LGAYPPLSFFINSFHIGGALNGHCREALGKPFMYHSDDTLIALACDCTAQEGITIPLLDINDVEAIANFIYENFYSG
jgi:hypothetical protein